MCILNLRTTLLEKHCLSLKVKFLFNCNNFSTSATSMCIRTTFLFFILTAGSQQISIYRSFLSVYLCCFFACQIKFFLQLQCKLKILFFLICSFLYELRYSKIANITGCGTWWNNKILSVCISIFAVIQRVGLVSVPCRACKQTR